MSALAPVATGLVRRKELTLRANRRHMHHSKVRAYSITSSARSRNDSGTLRPSVFAVFKLIANSHFVGQLSADKHNLAAGSGFKDLFMRAGRLGEWQFLEPGASGKIVLVS